MQSCISRGIRGVGLADLDVVLVDRYSILHAESGGCLRDHLGMKEFNAEDGGALRMTHGHACDELSYSRESGGVHLLRGHSNNGTHVSYLGGVQLVEA